MLDKSKLLEFNPHLGLLNGLFQDTREHHRYSQVDHGLQHAIAEIYAASDDRSLHSAMIEEHLQTDETRTALNPAPFNFLASIKFNNVIHALDLNEDFGGTMHFMSSRAKYIDAVRVDPDRARLSLRRCLNRDNICLISEDLINLEWPLNHYDLIVVGAIERLSLERDQRLALLARLRKSLSYRGVLIVGVPNTQALNLWFDADAGILRSENSFQSLYDSDHWANNLGDLQHDFEAAGFKKYQYFTSFSQRDHLNNLFSSRYLNDSQAAVNHFYRMGSIENPLVNEYALSNKVVELGWKLETLGSRYLFLAQVSNSNPAVSLKVDFIHYPGTSRKPQYRAITYKPADHKEVIKIAQFPKLKLENSDSTIRQNIGVVPYLKGKLLIVEWIEAALNNNTKRFAALVDEYADWLTKMFEEWGDKKFQELAYDLLPFNLIVTSAPSKARKFEQIDPEWQLNSKYGPEFVLFRALFWLAFENKSILRDISQQLNLPTLGMFVAHWLPSAENEQDLVKFTELEEQTQAQINGHFRAFAVTNALAQTFTDTDNTLFDSQSALQCQIQWGNVKGEMDETNAVFLSWGANTTSLNTELYAFDSKRPILRIDPLASKNIFSITRLEISDQNTQPLLKLETANDCLDRAKTVNIHVLADGETCVALSDDPHLLFDLSEVENIEYAKQCTIDLALSDSHHSRPAIDQLTSQIEQYQRSLLAQKNRLNEFKSENEFLNTRLQHEYENRDYLKKIINDMWVENRRLDVSIRHDEGRKGEIQILNNRVKRLQDLVVHQVNHNHAVDHYLMKRPSTRLKNLLTRMVLRILGKPISTEPEEAPNSDDLSILSGVDQAKEENVAIAMTAKKIANGASEKKEEELLGQNLEDYGLWVKQNTLSAAEIEAAKIEIENFEHKPVFSILVPVYNTDPDYLLPMIRSVQAQIYPHWQLCLVDDCSPRQWLRTILQPEAEKDDRIILKFNDKNKGIAETSNDALQLASGDYIALLDHDDELSVDALYENAKVINQRPDAGVIYSDEDKMDMQGNRLEPFFKPDYSPDLLDTNNYICHLTVMKKSIADRIGGFRKGFDGSQDHDIILRAIEESSYIHHIPKILYHWRKIPGSTAVQYDSKSYAWEAGRRAVEERVQKHDNFSHVEFGTLKGTYRVFRDIRGTPKVSIIIPFKDKAELLRRCIGAILDKTLYPNLEIIGISNNSEEAATQQAMSELLERDTRVRFIEKNIPFNFSALCNFGVENATGDYVVLLNNDVEIENQDWLERLLEHAQRPQYGAVGGKLLFPDGRIQHAGIVVGMVGAAGHPHKFFPDRHIGYHGRLHMVYNVSAVTGAMLMVKRAKYLEVGGLDEEKLPVAYNDVDFCLKLMKRGYLNLFTPHCRAIHQESVSRGYEDTDEKIARLKREQDVFLERWSEFIERGDPYYNPNLSLLNEHFSLKFDEERQACN